MAKGERREEDLLEQSPQKEWPQGTMHWSAGDFCAHGRQGSDAGREAAALLMGGSRKGAKVRKGGEG